jgi:large subunit ribosomal protein L24
MAKNKMKFKKGDLVLVIAGKDKGKQGHILKAMPSVMKVVVDGVNVINKRIKPSMDNPSSSTMSVEFPIHVSNVSHIDPRTGLRTKVGYKFTEDEGKKLRFSKKTGENI